MSKLRKWREREGISRGELAAMVGAADAMTVFRWEQAAGSPSRRIPAEHYMCQLYALSHGEVDPNSFYDLPDAQQLALPLNAGATPLLDRAA